MKLQHYLGGVEGLGPVTFEKRVFVEPWEKRIFGIHVAMMALSSQLPLPPTPSPFKTVWTWADLRKGAESLNPFDYFKYRYYEKWLGGISGYFVENGYVTQAELDARTQQFLGTSAPAPRTIRQLTPASSNISSRAIHPSTTAPRRRFAVGEKVLVKNPPTVEHPPAWPSARAHRHRRSGLSRDLQLSHLDRAGRHRRSDAGLLRALQSGGNLAGNARKRTRRSTPTSRGLPRQGELSLRAGSHPAHFPMKGPLP
jgi:hypothetical protein